MNRLDITEENLNFMNWCMRQETCRGCKYEVLCEQVQKQKDRNRRNKFCKSKGSKKIPTIKTIRKRQENY